MIMKSLVVWRENQLTKNPYNALHANGKETKADPDHAGENMQITWTDIRRGNELGK